MKKLTIKSRMRTDLVVELRLKFLEMDKLYCIRLDVMTMQNNTITKNEEEMRRIG